MLCVAGERAKFMSPATMVARAGCASATSLANLTRLVIRGGRVGRIRNGIDMGADQVYRANAVACGVNIPGFGAVNLISTHVYTVTDPAYTATQITNLVKFANDVALAHPARATIVAGDMNFALSPATQSIYDIFIANGFKDSYRQANAADAGFTYGVEGDPYATSTTPARIDFIFVKGNGS